MTEGSSEPTTRPAGAVEAPPGCEGGVVWPGHGDGRDGPVQDDGHQAHDHHGRPWGSQVLEPAAAALAPQHPQATPPTAAPSLLPLLDQAVLPASSWWGCWAVGGWQAGRGGGGQSLRIRGWVTSGCQRGLCALLSAPGAEDPSLLLPSYLGIP